MGYFFHSKLGQEQHAPRSGPTGDDSCRIKSYKGTPTPSASSAAATAAAVAAAAAAEAEVLQLRSHVLSLTTSFFDERRRRPQAWQAPHQRQRRGGSLSGASSCIDGPGSSDASSDCICEVETRTGGQDEWSSLSGSASLFRTPAPASREAEALKSSLELVTQALSEGMSQWTEERLTLLRELEEARAALAKPPAVATPPAARSVKKATASPPLPRSSAVPLPAAAAAAATAAWSPRPRHDSCNEEDDLLFFMPLPPAASIVRAGTASRAASRAASSDGGGCGGHGFPGLSAANQALLDELRAENEALTMALVMAKMQLAEAGDRSDVLARSLSKCQAQMPAFRR